MGIVTHDLGSSIEHIAEWVRLKDAKPAHVAQVSSKGGRGIEGGISAATRELGIDRTEAQRATKIAGLSDEAKRAAIETGRADNQAALLKASKAEPTKQAEAIRSYEPVRKPVSPAPAPMNDLETEEQWMASIMRIWNRAAPQWREPYSYHYDTVLFLKDMLSGADFAQWRSVMSGLVGWFQFVRHPEFATLVSK